MPKNKPLQKILSRELLRTLTSHLVYERGIDYYERGAVLTCEMADEIIQGQIQGSEIYTARYWLRGGKLQSYCSCPFAAEGAVCKHLVALGWHYCSLYLR